MCGGGDDDPIVWRALRITVFPITGDNLDGIPSLLQSPTGARGGHPVDLHADDVLRPEQVRQDSGVVARTGPDFQHSHTGLKLQSVDHAFHDERGAARTGRFDSPARRDITQLGGEVRIEVGARDDRIIGRTYRCQRSGASDRRSGTSQPVSPGTKISSGTNSSLGTAARASRTFIAYPFHCTWRSSTKTAYRRWSSRSRPCRCMQSSPPSSRVSPLVVPLPSLPEWGGRRTNGTSI